VRFRHIPALLSALTAFLSACFAMIHAICMSLAFFGAGVANTGARLAKGRRILASDHHELRSRKARRRALHIEADAPCHHLDILFLQTF
jgi:cytochrome b subunit of formate dehydrogenase